MVQIYNNKGRDIITEGNLITALPVIVHKSASTVFPKLIARNKYLFN